MPLHIHVDLPFMAYSGCAPSCGRGAVDTIPKIGTGGLPAAIPTRELRIGWRRGHDSPAGAASGLRGAPLQSVVFACEKRGISFCSNGGAAVSGTRRVPQRWIQ